MKKLLVSLLSLLCVATTWAGPTDLPEITTDLNNPIYYTIYNTRSGEPGGLIYYAGDEVGLKDGNCTSFTLEDKYQFFFTGTHDALYVHNKATNKKLASVSSWTEAGTVWAVGVSPMGGGLAFGPQGGLNGNSCWNDKNYATNANTSDFTTWTASDAGSIFVVESVSKFTIPETGNFYTIECPLFENVQGVKKGLYVKEDGALVWGTVDLTNKNHYWVPTVDAANSTIALKNLGTGKYINGTNMSDAIANATLKALGNNQFNIIANGTTVHANGHGGGVNASGNIVSWEGGRNSASAWSFVEQANPDAAVPVIIKYSFTYGGETKYTQETATIVGQQYPAFTVSFPFGVTATKPEGIISDEGIIEGVKTVEVALSVNLPFVPAASNTEINKWYYIQMHSSVGYSKYIQNMDTYIEWLDTDIDATDKDSYTWAFVGNPFDGFKLVNMKAGINKAVNTNGSDTPTVGDYETGVIWEIKNSRTNNDSEHFCFKFPGGKYMNAQSGKVAFWSDNDQGSTMWVTERNFAITADLEELVEKASAITDGTTGTTVGYYTQASLEVLQAAIDEANAAIGGEPTQDKVNELEAKITNAMAALKIVLPEEGKFYNIVSAHTGDRAGKQIYVSDDAGLKFDTPTGKNIANVFQFVPVEGQEDQFYVYNVERGLYISTNKAHATGQQKAEFAITNLAKPITIANMGSENIVKLTPVGGAMIHAQQANSVVVAWDNNDYTSASAWKIVEVEDMTKQLHTLKVGELGYSTIYLAYDAVIPAFEGDNGVYVAEQVNAEGTAMNLKKIEGVLPANTGAIVKAPQGEYEFAYSETAGTETSMLKGSTSDKNIVATANKNHYILSHEEGEVAFFKTTTSVLELDGEYVNIFFNHAFKAYLPIEQGSAARSLVFNFGGETGIHDIESGDLNGGNAEIYDLSGRRVQKAQKGLYIINGKKVVR